MFAPVLLDLTYDDDSSGLISMEMMQNFGRLVCFVLYMVAIY